MSTIELAKHATDQDLTTDVLVVGSGGGGLTAAIVAADGGADVLVIEKSPLVGGSTAISGGAIWIPCNHLMEEVQIRDSLSEARDYLAATIGSESEDGRLNVYLTTGPSLVAYLESRTHVRFRPGPLPDYRANSPGGKRCARALDPEPIERSKLAMDAKFIRPPLPETKVMGITFTAAEIARILRKEPGWLTLALKLGLRQCLDKLHNPRARLPRRLTLGSALIARALISLRERGVEVRASTALVRLIIEQGSVVGAIVSRNGQEATIRARNGVIIAAGGFSHNKAMRAAYLPASPNPQMSVAPDESMGDGIAAGVAAGGVLNLMGEAWWAPVYKKHGSPRSSAMFMERAFPGSIIVNSQACRFMNEAADYDLAGRAMKREIEHSSTRHSFHFIFDEQFRRSYLAGPLLPHPRFLDAFISRDAIRSVVSAPSIRELAKRIGLQSPSALETTIRDFNEAALSGCDREFGRGEEPYDRHYSDPSNAPNSTMRPIAKPPFYALRIYLGDIGTKGGLATDSDARVLNDSGEPILGLYAIGNSSSSPMLGAYPGGGATIGPAMVFGARAAMHALNINENDFFSRYPSET